MLIICSRSAISDNEIKENAQDEQVGENEEEAALEEEGLVLNEEGGEVVLEKTKMKIHIMHKMKKWE